MSAHLRYPLLLIPQLLLLLAACADTEEQGLDETEQPTPTEQPTATPTESPAPSPASPTPTPAVVPPDWKTYTDEEFGFSLRYPPDLAPSHLAGPTPEGAFVERAIEFRSPEDKSRVAAVSVSANPDKLTLADWAVEFAACRINSIEEIVLSGLPAIACTREVIESVLEPAVLTEDKGKVFLASAIGFSDSELSLLTASISFSD